MSQSTFRAARLFTIVVAGAFMWGTLACRVTLGTEITSPANINAQAEPAILLNQTGTGVVLPYQWNIFGDYQVFSVNNPQDGVRPFSIFGGAAENTLIVDISGVGIGVPIAFTPLHLNNGPIRIGKDDQVWDIFADSLGFDAVDVTGNTNPFRIRPGAPSYSLLVDDFGNVGFGTSIPATPIHVVKAAQSGVAETIARFEVSDDSIGKLEINNVSAGNAIFHPRLRGTTAAQAVPLTFEGLITTDSGSNPVVAYDAARRAGGAVVTRPLVVYRNNGTSKVTIAANGNVTATSFITASSRELKDKIAELTSDKASAALRQLTPVEFVYKDDASAEPRVGFIAEDVPDLIAEPDRKSVPVMDVVALLTRVVKDHDRLNEQQQETIGQQQKTIDELMKRLQALERLTSTGK